MKDLKGMAACRNNVLNSCIWKMSKRENSMQIPWFTSMGKEQNHTKKGGEMLTWRCQTKITLAGILCDFELERSIKKCWHWSCQILNFTWVQSFSVRELFTCELFLGSQVSAVLDM